jgi:hypothetical protein
MKTVKYELKYCEGCGTLKLRPVESPNTYCYLCERRLARFAFRPRLGAANSVELPSPAELKALAGLPLPGGAKHVAGTMS